MMQIAIANVFLPQVIKNDRTLRWVQIASGITMTLLQSATLFVGKPTPYYATFSALEIGATTFIAINAIKWKTNPKKQLPVQY
jgi:cyanate permease